MGSGFANELGPRLMGKQQQSGFANELGPRLMGKQQQSGFANELGPRLMGKGQGNSLIKENMRMKVVMEGSVNGHQFKCTGEGEGNPYMGTQTMRIKVIEGGPLPFAFDILATSFGGGSRTFIKYPKGIPDFFKQSFPEGFTWERVTRYEDGGVVTVMQDTSLEDGCLVYHVQVRGVNFPSNGPVMQKKTKGWEPNTEMMYPADGGLRGYTHMALKVDGGSGFANELGPRLMGKQQQSGFANELGPRLMGKQQQSGFANELGPRLMGKGGQQGGSGFANELGPRLMGKQQQSGFANELGPRLMGKQQQSGFANELGPRLMGKGGGHLSCSFVTTYRSKKTVGNIKMPGIHAVDHRLERLEESDNEMFVVQREHAVAKFAGLGGGQGSGFANELGPRLMGKQQQSGFANELGPRLMGKQQQSGFANELGPRLMGK
nr:mRuby2OLLAS [synthetic construct]